MLSASRLARERRCRIEARSTPRFSCRLLILSTALLFLGKVECFPFGNPRANGRPGGKALFRFLRREPKKVQKAPQESLKDNMNLKNQPKCSREETKLKQKYAAIDDIEERAYQVLLDLGLVEEKN